MPIKIYNSLTRKKEEFIPIEPGKIKMYTCGVTVYDDCHIGHARSLYVFDVIRRYLEYRGFKVIFVRNITDIDDKIINRSKELNIAWKDLVKKYIDRYYADLDALGIRKADPEPKATDNISDMIKHIEGLLDKGYAYIVESGVYFSVRRFKDYGKLSGQSIEQMLSGTRIEPDDAKKDPLDFALWKKSGPDEPYWDSPWGRGRPGWHIECSAMSQKFLNTDTLDIHAGGRDLIFPHHENEIAQAEALTGKPFAKYWMHHGLLTINAQKMAKSSGNFVTIEDFTNKYPPDILKFFFLHTHYSQPINFTWDNIEENREALDGIMIFLKRVREREAGKESLVKTDIKKKISPETIYNEVKEARRDFEKAMDDDFNTPNARVVLFRIVHACNKILYDTAYTKEYLPALTYAKKMIEEIGGVLGLSFEVGPLSMPKKKIEEFVNMRERFKKEKMFEESDQIRKELAEKGIILEDTKKGTTWRRKI